MNESLLDRLKALGLSRGMEKIKPQPRQLSYPIEQVMDGDLIETAFGSTFCVSEQYTVDTQYGRVIFGEGVDFSLLSEWSGCRPSNRTDIERIIFLDTETSGLAGGSGYYRL